MDKMTHNKTVTFYEHCDGLRVNGDRVVSLDFHINRIRIFDVFPETEIESFSYTSTYVDEIDFKCFKYFPPTLKIIELGNWRGVSTETIDKLIAQGVECHHQYEVPFSESGVPVYDDTQTYKLEDGYWLKI